MAATGYTPSILFNSVTTGNTPSSLVQGETAWNITDKKLWVGNASGTPIQLIGAGASMTLATLTTANDASISGLTVGKGGGSVATSTVVGNGAMAVTNTGANNSAFGYNAGAANTSGTQGAFFGQAAGASNTTGNYNSAFGAGALTSNTTGANNTALGYLSLLNNTTASNNTAVGYQAGYANTTGAGNTCLGYIAGYGGTALTTGSYNTYIGYNAQASAAASGGEMVLSTSGLVGKGNSTTYIANACYQGNNSAAWSITSDQRLKKNIVDNTVGLSAINAIQVRNFEYRTADEITDLPTTSAIDIQGVQLGAIAQELKEILPDCVKTESTGVMSVDTTNLTWYLINAVKELNAKLEAQAVEIATLKGQ